MLNGFIKIHKDITLSMLYRYLLLHLFIHGAIFLFFLLVLVFFIHFFPIAVIFQQNSLFLVEIDPIVPSSLERVLNLGVNMLVVLHFIFFDQGFVQGLDNLFFVQVLRNEDRLVSLISNLFVPKSLDEIFRILLFFFCFSPHLFGNFTPSRLIQLIVNSGSRFL